MKEHCFKTALCILCGMSSHSQALAVTIPLNEDELLISHYRRCLACEVAC